MRLAALFALVALASCQSPGSDGAGQPIPDSTPAAGPAVSPDTAAPSMTGPGVQLSLDRAQYASGADVTLTMLSKSSASLGYNSCTRQVELETSGAWAVVPEPDRVCTMELRTLGSGETITETTDLPQLQPGRYRIALRFSDDDSRSAVRALSPPFTVR